MTETTKEQRLEFQKRIAELAAPCIEVMRELLPPGTQVGIAFLFPCEEGEESKNACLFGQLSPKALQAMFAPHVDKDPDTRFKGSTLVPMQ